MGVSQSEAPAGHRKEEAQRQKPPALRLQPPVVKLGGSRDMTPKGAAEYCKSSWCSHGRGDYRQSMSMAAVHREVREGICSFAVRCLMCNKGRGEKLCPLEAGLYVKCFSDSPHVVETVFQKRSECHSTVGKRADQATAKWKASRKPSSSQARAKLSVPGLHCETCPGRSRCGSKRLYVYPGDCSHWQTN